MLPENRELTLEDLQLPGVVAEVGIVFGDMQRQTRGSPFIKTCTQRLWAHPFDEMAVRKEPESHNKSGLEFIGCGAGDPSSTEASPTSLRRSRCEAPTQ
jgi:hypothetical protein